MLTFAVEAGLHFLRMLELQRAVEELSRRRSSRSSRCNRSRPAPRALVDDATVALHAVDGRARARRAPARGCAATRRARRSSSLDPALNIATADRAEGAAGGRRLARVVRRDVQRARRARPTMRGIRRGSNTRSRSATRLSAHAQDEMTFSATEIDGADRLEHRSTSTRRRRSRRPRIRASSSLVEATIPAPVTFPGAPAPRFWEMEDARLAYGLVPVGPTDLAHLMMIEYASSYGNDWFVVPLTLPVGSVTRVDSLVVTDTFGVRNLVRPIGDPALPRAVLLDVADRR